MVEIVLQYQKLLLRAKMADRGAKLNNFKNFKNKI